MKKTAVISTLLITLLANGCSLIKYNSRQEALTACKNWENEKPVKIFIPSGSMRSKVCNLEIEARQVLGREIKNPVPLKVYTEDMIEKEMKIVRYFRY